MGDNFLDNSYPICRSIIELYVKLLIIELIPELLKEHDLFAKYDLKKTCCGEKYPEDFDNKYNHRKNQKEKSKIDYLHYGWVDLIDDYHEIVTRNQYSINGLICYLEEKYNYEFNFEDLKFFYKMCHSYTHGNVIQSKYPLLHYFEITLMISLTIPHTYEMLCKHANCGKEIEGVDILTLLMKDIKILSEQYCKRSTENFETYYNYKK